MKKIQNSKKAISPVIATILLIGVAIGSGALAYSWYTGVQKGTQEASGGVSGRVAQATGAAIAILDVVNYTTGAGGTITFKLKNIGSSGFAVSNTYASSDVRVFLDSTETNSTTFSPTGTLSPGSTTTVTSTFSSISSGQTYTLQVTTAQGGLATRTVIT